MALSKKAQEALRRAVTEDKAADEIQDMLEAGANPVAAEVDEMADDDLSALAAPAAVDLNAVFSDVEVESALDAKADQDAVQDSIDEVETRLDALDAKINEILQALKDANLMNS